jgi:hypothetical protein
LSACDASAYCSVPGKSDPLDARAVALAAIKAEAENLPVAFPDEPGPVACRVLSAITAIS